MLRVGVITSGGDAPGMNACVKAITEAGIGLGIKVFGFYRGYQGIIENDVKELKKEDVKFVLSFGGSFLQSARSMQFMEEKYRNIALENIRKLKLNAVICIGGNGTFKGALTLAQCGINVIAIPATVDNDVYSSERSIGFDTAVYNAVNMIDNIKQTMSSNGRIAVIEVMGRHGGDIALYSALASNSDMVVVPEEPVTRGEIVRRVKLMVEAGNSSPTVIVAEKQHDIKKLTEDLEREIDKECRPIVLGYMQRGGSPTANDRILATRYGVQAMHLIKNESGSCALCLKNDLLSTMDIEEALTEKSHFRSDMYALFGLLHDRKLILNCKNENAK